MDIRFPGESQMIDRIIERFSQRYYECNESAFATQVGPWALTPSCSVRPTSTDAETHMAACLDVQYPQSLAGT